MSAYQPPLHQRLSGVTYPGRSDASHKRHESSSPRHGLPIPTKTSSNGSQRLSGNPRASSGSS
eukprot:5869617-Prorocentrum_lima.AAC.1